jgi:hypothetical protein
MRATKAVAIFAITYVVSTALFVDGVPIPAETSVTLLEESGGDKPPALVHTLGEDNAGGFNPNLVDTKAFFNGAAPILPSLHPKRTQPAKAKKCGACEGRAQE